MENKENIVTTLVESMVQEKYQGHYSFSKLSNGASALTELRPNEAEYLVNLLQSKGIDANYEYLRGSYYQVVQLPKNQKEDKIKRILGI